MRYLPALCAASLMTALASAAQAAPLKLYAPITGDATYGWNSKYGPYGYGEGANSLGVGLSMGGSYGNDYTVTIIEIPISELFGTALSNALLQVNSEGFGTGYYYGSAAIGWLDVGTTPLTGNVVADGLGGLSTGRPSHWTIYTSGAQDQSDGSPGVKSFDVTSYVQADLDAGRAYSTFVMSGSRDTYGGIMAAETGLTGPRIVAEVPEPASVCLAALGVAGLLMRRRAAR